jgi:hypothetical protein
MAWVCTRVVVLGVVAVAGRPFCPCDSCNRSSFATYRLADTYEGAREPSRVEYACFWGNDLITCDYARSHAEPRDRSAMVAAIKRAEEARGLVALPRSSDVVWHLRLGDTVMCEGAFADPCQKGAYVQGRDFFEAAVRGLRSSSTLVYSRGLPRVTLVYSVGHVGCKTATARSDDVRRDARRRSLDYVRDATAYLRGEGFDVRERRDLHPDEDMIYLCHAGVLVLSGGGYSALAAECAFVFSRGSALILGPGRTKSKLRNTNRADVAAKVVEVDANAPRRDRRSKAAGPRRSHGHEHV